jgi:hypothetical protein
MKLTFAIFASISGLFLILQNSIYAQDTSNIDNSSQLNSGLNSLFKSLLSQNLNSLEKDISGHYNNTEFGIKDIVFPNGWHGREIASVLGLTVTMKPGTLSEHQASIAALFNQSNQTKAQPIKPSITLQVINNDQVNKIGFLPMDVSYSKYCKQLEQNSTSTIDEKVFNVMKIECPLSSLISNMFSSVLNNKENTSLQPNNSLTTNDTASPSNNSTSGGNLLSQSKIFEYKTPTKTYRLALSVSNSIFSPSVEKPDINKYNSIIEDVAKTLKIN